MKKTGKTYRYTVKLRKKPLSGGRFALILDYYNGNVEYLSEEQRGERVRQHLGLYLIPENTSEDAKKNIATMEKAKSILAEKQQEINEQISEGLEPIVKVSKECPAEISSSLKKGSDTDEDNLQANSFRCNLNDKTRISMHLHQKKLKGGRMSLFLDFNIGSNVIFIGEDRITGRKRKFLGLYLSSEDTPEAHIANEQNMRQAQLIYERVRNYILNLKQGQVLPLSEAHKEIPVGVSEDAMESVPVSVQSEKDHSIPEYKSRRIDSFVLTEEEDKTYHQALDKLDNLLSDL